MTKDKKIDHKCSRDCITVLSHKESDFISLTDMVKEF